MDSSRRTPTAAPTGRVLSRIFGALPPPPLAYTSTCQVKVNGERVSLSGTAVVWADLEMINFQGQDLSEIMPPTTYAWSVDLLMEMDPSNNGRIMYTVQNGNFDAPPTVQPVDQSAWDRFLNAIGGAIQDFVKDPGDIRETLDSQILGRIVPALTQSINTVNGFIFPGGASFLFKNSAFSNSDDLVANITYMTPAAKSGGASLIEKTSPYNLETSTELMKSHKASHTLSDQSDFQVLQNAQGLSLFFGISDTNVLYLSMERTNISTGWTPMDLTAELAVNFPGKTVTAKSFAV